MVATDLETARADRRERLVAGIRQIAGISELPAGRVDQLTTVREVLDAADDLARLSELQALCDTIDAESDGFPEAAKYIGLIAKLRQDDRLILGHVDEDLRLLRIDFNGTEAEIPELHCVLRSTSGGSLMMESTVAGERATLAFAGEFQFIVGGATEATLRGLERHLLALKTSRGRELFGLKGQQLLKYGLGFGFRAAWGSGTATLTDQRMLGVIFDDDMQGRPRSTEDAWMPLALVAADISSIIAFDIPRAAITELEVLDKGLLGRRIPYANLSGGAFTLACQTFRLFDSERLVKPRRDVLTGALRAFASTRS